MNKTTFCLSNGQVTFWIGQKVPSGFFRSYGKFQATFWPTQCFSGSIVPKHGIVYFGDQAYQNTASIRAGFTRSLPGGGRACSKRPLNGRPAEVSTVYGETRDLLLQIAGPRANLRNPMGFCLFVCGARGSAPFAPGPSQDPCREPGCLSRSLGLASLLRAGLLPRGGAQPISAGRP